MNKYNIEGKLQFYESLNKLIENNSDDENDNNDDKCLITNEPLTDYFISLSCGHKFNYKPLYNDLVYYKSKSVKQEYAINRLELHQIRCPYCRCKINNLLPYYKELGLELVNGINMYNIALPGPSYIPNIKCEYIIDGIVMCNSTYGTNIVNDKDGNIIGDNKYYCKHHTKTILKNHRLELKEKLKIEKAMKQKAKEDAMILKLKAKEDIKNIVISNISSIECSTDKCIHILSSGTNKGNTCGKKNYMDNLCKRHYEKLLNKNNI